MMRVLVLIFMIWSYFPVAQFGRSLDESHSRHLLLEAELNLWSLRKLEALSHVDIYMGKIVHFLASSALVVNSSYVNASRMLLCFYSNV